LFAFVAGLLAVMAARTVADTPDDEKIETMTSSPVAVQRLSVSSLGLSDEAAMVLAGTALIGLAAAVRRAA
jgi:hypothetical protein